MNRHRMMLVLAGLGYVPWRLSLAGLAIGPASMIFYREDAK
jgi:hypothetical protein